MKIGVLKEKAPEKRVVLMPESVKTLVGLKVELLVEKEAGKEAFVDDKEYTEAGAQVANRKAVIEQADVLLVINPLEKEEVKMLGASKVLIGALNPYSNKPLIEELVATKTTSFLIQVR